MNYNINDSSLEISQSTTSSNDENQKHSEEQPGGYMAIYHDIEEICYGPESGFPEIMRVFLCIRHKLLRDGLGQKQITYRFISEKTGLTKANIIPCVKKLQKIGFIIISQNKIDLGNGKFQYHENSYSLNPKKFGNIYNWYKNNPTVRVYQGSKVGSFSKHGLAPGEEVTLVSNQTPGVVSDPIPGVVSDQIPPNDVKLSELLEKIASNNPSINNPKTKNPISKSDFFGEGKGIKKQRTPEEHSKIVQEQLEKMKAGIPLEENPGGSPPPKKRRGTGEKDFLDAPRRYGTMDSKGISEDERQVFSHGGDDLPE